MDEQTQIKQKVEDLMQNYNEEQLKDMLLKNGLGNMPVTKFTKGIIVKKLAKTLLGLDGNFSLHADSAPKEVQTSETDAITVDRTVESENSNSSDTALTFYTVCIPEPTNTITIYDNFKDMMKAMTENKSKHPRMLSFKSRIKAEEFASSHSAVEICEGTTIKTIYPQEKAEIEANEVKLFPSLSPPQINKFRIQLEKGNLAFVRESINTNPRYLVGHGDMPVILKEGPRYNAMHASVVAGRLESCQLIMETVSDVNFLRKIYNNEKQAENCSARLVDLYLNTPDKAAKKTPLHWACERGMVDIVAFLVTFKACVRQFNSIDSNLTQAERAEEVVCSRYTKSDIAAVKARILELIQGGTCFVPLIRSDTTGPYATVGSPYSPTSPYRLVSEIEGDLCESRSQTEVDGSRLRSRRQDQSPLLVTSRSSVEREASLRDVQNMKVWAYAGPMSPQRAEEFRIKWRHNKGSNQSGNVKIVDGDRGYERYGRALADEHNTSWQEYWPFLDAFVDLRSPEGLKKLEYFFLKKRAVLRTQAFIKAQSNENQSVCEVPRHSLDSTNDTLHSVQFEEKSLNSEQRLHSLFITSAPYKVGSLYVLNPENRKNSSLPDSELSVSGDEDDDRYFSAESEGEEEATSADQNQSPSFLGSLWQNLKHYISPREQLKQPGLSCPNTCLETKDSNSTPKARWKKTSTLSGCHDFSSSKDTCRPLDQVKPSPCSTDTLDRVISTPCSTDILESVPSPCSKKSNDQSSRDSLPSSKPDGDASSLWQFRTSTSAIQSPECSPPGKERIHDDCDSVDPFSEAVTPKHNKSETGTKLCVGAQSRTSKVGSHESSPHPTPTELPSSDSCADESFNTKLNKLCDTLSQFSIQSPISSSYDNEDNTSEISSHFDNFEDCDTPCIHLYVGAMYSQFVSNLTSPSSSSQTPTLLLRQAPDNDQLILADVFVLQAGTTLAADSPIMPQESQRLALQCVWVNFVTAFPDKWHADQICWLDKWALATVVVTGHVGTMGQTGSKECCSYQDCHDCFIRCKEEEDLSSSLSTTVQMNIVRTSCLCSNDLYIYGRVATKVDGDVYHTMMSSTKESVPSLEHFPLTRLWLTQMKARSSHAIDSLPSPHRVLRSFRQAVQPLSPLVKGDTPSSTWSKTGYGSMGRRSGKQLFPL